MRQYKRKRCSQSRADLNVFLCICSDTSDLRRADSLADGVSSTEQLLKCLRVYKAAFDMVAAGFENTPITYNVCALPKVHAYLVDLKQTSYPLSF